MSMQRQKQLLDYLIKQSNQWVNAQELSDALGVSTRQIRKYIVAINGKCEDLELIISGPKGYCLVAEKYFPYKEKIDTQKEDTPQTRQHYIIQKLISALKGYSIFDFSDELFISVPAIENDLKSIRKILEHYELKLVRKKELLFIEGEEIIKRTLMRNLVLPDSYDSFVLKDEIQLLTFHYHFWDLRKNIHRILKAKELFTNDYMLNNIALHVIVMIDRIRSGGLLVENNENHKLFEQAARYEASKDLTSYISEEYHIPINQAEIYYLTLTISNNTTIADFSSINISNINQYINVEYIEVAGTILQKVERVYRLDPFDDEFKTRFIIHVNSMFTRVQNSYNIRNPLKEKMKIAFPLIYDIAVFIAQEFKQECTIHLSEDEIAFIALHIGGYFENNRRNQTKVTCAFIYTNYYDNYKNAVKKISRVFADTLTIKYIISMNQYKSEELQADIIISPAELDIPGRQIIISPFLTELDMDNIRNAVVNIIQINKVSLLKSYLFDFISPRLFYKNPGFKDKAEAIITMSKDAIKLGYAHETLTENVFLREELSGTGFSGIAVPHSLQDDAIKSFISFAINTTPVKWGERAVHIIILIGVNNDSRKIFTEVFDVLIDILSEAKDVKTLVSTVDYKDFYQKLTAQMEILCGNTGCIDTGIPGDS